MSPSKCFTKQLGRFPNFLIYLIVEWSIICILFINGMITFCSNEIARLFGLKTPCLLCTRFNHVLVPRNKNFFYNDSICEEHKKNISSLTYCVRHKKLSSIKTMCDGCLLSFASETNLGCDYYKHLVGTLDKDIETLVEDNKKSKNIEDNVQFEKIIGGEKCSCCGETLKARTSIKYDRSNSIKSTFIFLSPSASPRRSFISQSPTASPGRSFISQSPIASPRGRLWKSEETNLSCRSLKFAPKSEANTPPQDEISTGGEDFIETGADAPIVHESVDTTPRFRMSENVSLDDQVELVSGPSYADGAMNEVDSDHIINRLKREVRLDRRSLIELYMELDEERNASAIAADEAMAMITRLQAEKAAMQMEALQYQRMMEEEAEYDQEALQALTELVLKRENEIDELEFELENYRHKYDGHSKRVDSEVCEVDAEEYHEMKSRSFSSSSEKSHPGSPKKKHQTGENEHCTHESVTDDFGTQDGLAFDIERDRSYLLGLLKNLEKNIEQSSEELPSSSPDRETELKATFTREMSMIRERLRALEAESGFLRRASMTIRKGGEGTKLLSEIAEHLRKLRPAA